jgi:beta-lactamase regulating signal transducer with metallopeptidase domain
VTGRGNRAFAAFISACAAAFALIGMGACMLLGIVAYRVQRDGFAALTANGNDVRPALVFLLIVAAGTMAGLWSLGRQWRATRRLQARVEELRVMPTPSLLEAAAQVGVAGQVDLVDANEPFSFTHGVRAARIVLSRGLADSLTDDELVAVLEHERYHVRNLDPLKVFLTRLLAPMLFFLPTLRELRARYIADRELAADRRALRRYGQRPLAGALYKVVGSPTWVQLSPAAALGGGEALEARVSQLETGEPPKAPRFSRTAIVLTGLGGAVLLATFSASVFAFGGPAALARLCGGG